MDRTLIAAVIAFTLLALGFIAIERLWPAVRGQRLLRDGWKTDAVYWLFTPIVSKNLARLGIGVMLAALLLISGAKVNRENIEAAIAGRDTWFSTWPIWVQALSVLVLSDFTAYWMHRAFHGRLFHASERSQFRSAERAGQGSRAEACLEDTCGEANAALRSSPPEIGRERGLKQPLAGWLWRVHAVHHSSRALDWLASVRLHPLNELITRMVQVLPFYFLGFSPLVLAGVAPFLSLYAILLHANVNWSFGPLRYVIASPLFHRWHHTSEEEGLDKNFAGLLPIWDLLFGTWHMPQGKYPQKFGIVGNDMPESLWGQMMYPFRVNRSPTSASFPRQCHR